jgi:hypothetical protein
MRRLSSPVDRLADTNTAATPHLRQIKIAENFSGAQLCPYLMPDNRDAAGRKKPRPGGGDGDGDGYRLPATGYRQN